jgi:hypothetical protein
MQIKQFFRCVVQTYICLSCFFIAISICSTTIAVAISSTTVAVAIAIFSTAVAVSIAICSTTVAVAIAIRTTIGIRIRPNIDGCTDTIRCSCARCYIIFHFKLRVIIHLLPLDPIGCLVLDDCPGWSWSIKKPILPFSLLIPDCDCLDWLKKPLLPSPIPPQPLCGEMGGQYHVFQHDNY